MAEDKLVDSTQLDNDLTSIANAIRAKSGGSSQLAFPSGFVSEIGNIPSGGGGVKTETGSFTVGGSPGLTHKVITHSLNTNKIFGLVWLEPDENDEVVCPQGYTLIFLPFTTVPWINNLYSGTTLVCDYTSNATKTKEYADTINLYLRRQRSAWTNAAADWGASGIPIQQCVDASTVTTSSFDILGNYNGGSAVAYFGAGKTYYWQIWALE